jgi:glycosyltransferase involved in cell wall biosynthesis
MEQRACKIVSQGAMLHVVRARIIRHIASPHKLAASARPDTPPFPASNGPPSLHIAFLSNLFPTPSGVTRGIFNLQLAQAMRPMCDLTVICPLPKFPSSDLFRKFTTWHAMGRVPLHYSIDGIPVWSPKYPMLPKVSGAIQARLMEWGIGARLRAAHTSRPFDAILALWLYPDAVAASQIAAALDVPVVPVALGSDVNRMFGERDKRGQIVAMLRRAPQIISVSNALASRIAEIGVDPGAIRVIPNGVDTSRFRARDRRAAREALGIDPSARVVLYAGRLSPEKGLAVLLRAASRAPEPFELHIVGDGALLGELRSLAFTLGIDGLVRFTGNVDHQAVCDWMSACDVFCLPSITEGCPNVVNEAMACGRPVVASNVGGLPDMVDESCGILVAPGDPQALSGALMAALARPWPEKAIAATMRKQTWQAAAEQYLETLEIAMSMHARTDASPANRLAHRREDARH